MEYEVNSGYNVGATTLPGLHQWHVPEGINSTVRLFSDDSVNQDYPNHRRSEYAPVGYSHSVRMGVTDLCSSMQTNARCLGLATKRIQSSATITLSMINICRLSNRQSTSQCYNQLRSFLEPAC